jgi:hypothetical protein
LQPNAQDVGSGGHLLIGQRLAGIVEFIPLTPVRWRSM